MLKKIISMATATLVLAGGLSVVAAPMASATGFSITLGSISAQPVAGTASNPYVVATTSNISSAPLTVGWVTDISGSTSRSAPTGISVAARDMVANDSTTVRFTILNTAQAGTYFYKVSYGMSVSAVGTLTVGAARADVHLSNTTKIKGATVTSLGTPNSTSSSVVRGSVTLTAEQAADTTGGAGFETEFIRADQNTETPMIIIRGASDAVWAPQQNLSSMNFDSTTVVTDGQYIQMVVVDSNDNSNWLWYIFDITVTPDQQQNNNSSSSSSSDNSAAIAAAAEAQRQAAVAVAKSELVSTLKAGGPITAASLNAADIAVASAKAADRVIAKVAALPEAKRTDLAAIAAIVKTENFVDKVSTPATQITVTTRDLVIQELLTADYKYKTSIVKAILSKEASALDTIEKIQAVVKAELAAIDARKARIAAVQARVLTYSKK